MFHGHGIILKWRVHIGLREMPYITRFREQAEVGKLKPSYHFHILGNKVHVGVSSVGRVGKDQKEKDDIDGDVYQEKAGFPHVRSVQTSD